MKTYDARQEILKYGKPFATQFGKYEIQFEPHLLGSLVRVSFRSKDDFCGDWLLADAPAGFIVALGAAAKQLICGADPKPVGTRNSARCLKLSR